MQNSFVVSCRALALALALTVGSIPALSDQAVEFPSRKSGYWEIQMVDDAGSGIPAMSVHACIDAASDKTMMAAGLSLTKDMCKKIDMKRDGDAIVMDSECQVAGMTSTSKTVISGDFQAAYTVKITGSINGMPAMAGGADKTPQKMAMTQNAKWLSDKCPAGVTAGDMRMPGGITVNVNKILGKSSPAKAEPQPGDKK